MNPILGENSKRKVEELLIDDLKNHGINNVFGLSIDWESALGEGGGVEYCSEYMENASDVVVIDKEGELYSGWTDYVVDASGNLYAYWTQLRELKYEKKRGRLKFKGNSFGIPDHVWIHFSEEDKYHFARTKQGWHGDVNLLPYRIEVMPELISNRIAEHQKFDIENLKRLNTAIDIDFLASEMERYIKFSEKVLSKTEKTHPSQLIKHINDEYDKLTGLERSGDERAKKIREYFDSIDGFCDIAWHAEVIFRIAKEKGLFRKKRFYVF